MIYVCRPAGTLSVPGVYGGVVDKFPLGALMNKGLTLRTGQTHVNRWTDYLLRLILELPLRPRPSVGLIEQLSDQRAVASRRPAVSMLSALLALASQLVHAGANGREIVGGTWAGHRGFLRVSVNRRSGYTP
jgi:hypothetical protein